MVRHLCDFLGNHWKIEEQGRVHFYNQPSSNVTQHCHMPKYIDYSKGPHVIFFLNKIRSVFLL